MNSPIKESADAYNVQDTESINKMANSQVVIPKSFSSYVSETSSYQKPSKSKDEKSVTYDFGVIVNHIIHHEGLIKGQTPFRYTNPTMRKWNTIHGFEIDKISPRPPDRINFIFLKNPSDVPKAVKKQFDNYANAPERYGLPANPTLKDALMVFDQTGVKGKIDYLKQQMPSLNIDTPLKLLIDV